MTSCGNPEVEQDALMSRRPKFDKSKECVKCKIGTGKIVIRHSVYCKECFFPLVSTKFRRSLEPSVNPDPDQPRRKALKASGNLLLACSGGLGSAVLLDLVQRSYFSKHFEPNKGNSKLRGGKDHPRNAPVWTKVAVCYVEPCSAFPGMIDRTEDVRLFVNKYNGFRFIPLRVEDAFDNDWWARAGGEVIPTDLGIDFGNEDLLLTSLNNGVKLSPTSRLQRYIASLPTKTAIPTAIQNLTRLLLLHTAKTAGSSHLLLGTSLTSLSVSLISSIAQGGGFVVKEETQEQWVSISSATPDNQTHPVLRIIRPLREVGIKECAIWAWWNGIAVPGREEYPVGRQSIGTLTKDFIMGLERDFPSTVSTIARTCGKLSPKGGTDRVCILCERFETPARPVRLHIQDWKAQISMRSLGEATNQSQLSTSLTPHLCYPCHTTLTSRSSRGTTTRSEESDLVPLPVWANSRLYQLNGSWSQVEMSGDDMKNRIADFLLEE